MDAAEYNEPAIAAAGGHLAELVAVPPQIAMGDYLILLIMVSQDHQPTPHVAAHRLNPLGQLLVGERLVRLKFKGRGRRESENS